MMRQMVGTVCTFLGGLQVGAQTITAHLGQVWGQVHVWAVQGERGCLQPGVLLGPIGGLQGLPEPIEGSLEPGACLLRHVESWLPVLGELWWWVMSAASM